MRLIDEAGYGVELRVTGYQFPDAEDPGQRYSWHMVEGTASCPAGTWTFRYPALTCDESPLVASWLRDVARGGRPAALAFTEPNLAMSVTGHRPGGATLEIALDLEFSPPWRQGRGAGDPFIVGCEPSLSRISAAADEWERELAPFPPGPPLPPRPLGPPDPPGSPGLG